MISQELRLRRYWGRTIGILFSASFLTVTGCAAPRVVRQSVAKVRPSVPAQSQIYQPGNAATRSTEVARLSSEVRNARRNMPVGPTPELSKTFTQIPFSQGDLTYFDATMKDGANPDAEIKPIDEVFQWLRDEQFKCLSTHRVSWQGIRGTANGRQSLTKRYVIQCEGNCEGLRYRYRGKRSALQAVCYHFGLSRPYPVLHFRSVLLGHGDFQWEFERDTDSRPAPLIRIHTWSPHFGDAGPGCKID